MTTLSKFKTQSSHATSRSLEHYVSHTQEIPNWYQMTDVPTTFQIRIQGIPKKIKIQEVVLLFCQSPWNYIQHQELILS
jgi:hypothetical protein